MAAVGDVKGAIRTDRDGVGKIEIGLPCRTLVPAEATVARSGDGRDDAGGIDLANA